MEIRDVHSETLPQTKLVGKRYTMADANENGSYSHKWVEWFNNQWFTTLEGIGGIEKVSDDFIGLIRSNNGEAEYWIGKLMSPSATVPEGFDSVDLPECDIGVCYLYGNKDNGELFGKEAWDLCAKAYSKIGWDMKENGVYLERYNGSRFKDVAEQGNVILDICMVLTVDEPIVIDTYCGLSCKSCEYRESVHCGGCVSTCGKPFHGPCELAECAIKHNVRICGECPETPCELLKRFSFDQEHGDNGERIKNCNRIKKALVTVARRGLDPVAPCGFHCDHCFLGQWCGGCRSDYNCCSFATICEGGVCPNVSCSKEHGYDGCWECADLADCEKGFFAKKDEYLAKAASQFVGKYGKEKYAEALAAVKAHCDDESQAFVDCKSVDDAFQLLKKWITL